MLKTYISLSKFLAETIFDVIANENSSPVGVLWVFNDSALMHFYFMKYLFI